jgi:hypothetical protein
MKTVSNTERKPFNDFVKEIEIQSSYKANELEVRTHTYRRSDGLCETVREFISPCSQAISKRIFASNLTLNEKLTLVELLSKKKLTN